MLVSAVPIFVVFFILRLSSNRSCSSSVTMINTHGADAMAAVNRYTVGSFLARIEIQSFHGRVYFNHADAFIFVENATSILGVPLAFMISWVNAEPVSVLVPIVSPGGKIEGCQGKSLLDTPLGVVH